MLKSTRWISLLVVLTGMGCTGPRGELDLRVRDRPRFLSIVLGVSGGLTEGNLSCYLLAPYGTSDFVALDAGTLTTGLLSAGRRGNLSDIEVPRTSNLTREAYVRRDRIKAYLISHAHLDHVAGLVVNSPDDTAKEIMGLARTVDHIRDHLFNWKIWPNFGDEGAGLHLNTYHYVRMEPGQEYTITGTSLAVVSFSLAHSKGYESTAFLIRSGQDYALYFGDTGPDEIEKSDKMRSVWTRVAPLVREGRLRAIFLEVSYPEEHPDDQLYGHLTPSWMIKELKVLAGLVDPRHPQRALQQLSVVVTHIKPGFMQGPSTRELIRRQLTELNDLGVRFILAEQGQRLEF